MNADKTQTPEEKREKLRLARVLATSLLAVNGQLIRKLTRQ